MYSRVAKQPVAIPGGVTVKLDGTNLSVKGPNGELSFNATTDVDVKITDNEVLFSASETARSAAMAGTARALTANNVKGVTDGFSKKS